MFLTYWQGLRSRLYEFLHRLGNRVSLMSEFNNNLVAFHFQQKVCFFFLLFRLWGNSKIIFDSDKVFPKVNELIDYLLEKGKLQPTYLPSRSFSSLFQLSVFFLFLFLDIDMTSIRYGYIFRDKFASAGDYLLAGYAGRSDLFSVGETVPRDEGGDGERRKEENQEEEREAKRRRIE